MRQKTHCRQQNAIHCVNANYLCRWVEEDEWLSIELLVNQQTKNTHHGGTALVELLGAKVVLGLLAISSNESYWERGGREVSRVGALSLLPSGEFQNTAEGKDLEKTSGGYLENGGMSGWDIGEGKVLRAGDEARKADARPGGQVSKEGKLADTSVLDLNTTEAVEAVLVSILEEAKRIEESKRRLNTKFALESHVEGGGGSLLGNRGEGGGRAGKEGRDGELHLD